MDGRVARRRNREFNAIIPAMSWAGQRKILYFFGFILFLLVVVGLPWYFLSRRPATCFDGVQDQGEQGIDCGGPCTNLCAPLELSPVVLWSRIFTIAPGVYSVAARVENPNAAAEAFAVPYTFSIYDAENNLIVSRSNTTFIPPGQDFLILESDVALPTDTTQSASPARVTFKFTAPIGWRSAPSAAAEFNDLKIQNISSVFPATSSPEISADIANISFTDLPRVDVGVILYDNSGNAIGVSKTYVDSLPHQTSQHIVFTWIEPFIPPPARQPEFLYVITQPSPASLYPTASSISASSE